MKIISLLLLIIILFTVVILSLLIISLISTESKTSYRTKIRFLTEIFKASLNSP